MKRMIMHRPEGVLVLADGSIFEGELIGAHAMGRGGSPSPDESHAGEERDSGVKTRFGTAALPRPSCRSRREMRATWAKYGILG